MVLKSIIMRWSIMINMTTFIKQEWQELNVFLKIIFITVIVCIGTDVAYFIYGVGQDLGDAVYYNILKPIFN